MKLVARGLNSSRRWFMKKALVVAGATGAGTRLLADDHNGRLTKGDAALLRFAAAAEILESDFWVQYNELGGIQDQEVSGGSGSPILVAFVRSWRAIRQMDLSRSFGPAGQIASVGPSDTVDRIGVYTGLCKREDYFRDPAD